MKAATVSTAAWFSTATAAPARCFWASRAGRRSRGGAAGVSGTAAVSPADAASAASRGPSRSKTWVTSGRTSWPRASPVTHSTASTPRCRRPFSSCSSTMRFRSRQASVIHGRAPAACSSDASRSAGSPAGSGARRPAPRRSRRPACPPPWSASAPSKGRRCSRPGSAAPGAAAPPGPAPARRPGAGNTHGCRYDLAAAVLPHPAARSHHHVLRAALASGVSASPQR